MWHTTYRSHCIYCAKFSGRQQATGCTYQPASPVFVQSQIKPGKNISPSLITDHPWIMNLPYFGSRWWCFENVSSTSVVMSFPPFSSSCQVSFRSYSRPSSRTDGLLWHLFTCNSLKEVSSRCSTFIPCLLPYQTESFLKTLYLSLDFPWTLVLVHNTSVTNSCVG